MGRKERIDSYQPWIKEIQTKCSICQMERDLTFHHLIPRTLHTNSWFKKNFSREELDSGINICRLCHDKLHFTWDEKTLGRELNTLQKILETEEIKKFIPFAQKQK